MAYKIDYSQYDGLCRDLNAALLQQVQRAAKVVLGRAVRHTLPNDPVNGAKTLNTKAIRRLQANIKKDWLGREQEKGKGIATAVFYTRRKVRLQGFSNLPFAVQIKGDNQRKIYHKQPVVNSGSELIRLANDGRTKSATYKDAHKRRSRIDSRRDFRGYIKSLIFTTVSALRQAARLSAARAGALIAGWTAAANKIEFSGFKSAVPKNASFTRLGSAELHKTADSFRFTATNNAAPSERQAKKHNRIIEGRLESWWNSANDQEARTTKKELREKIRAYAATVN